MKKNKSNLSTYCISHKYDKKLDKLQLKLIGSGAFKKNFPAHWLNDAEGIKNISKKNYNYGSLTSIYWIWKNDIKNAPYMFAVAGEDGRCEYGLGDTENTAFEDCTKFQEENNIVGTCELYGKAGKVVWDGSVWEDSVKVSKSASKEVSTIETNESVDYVERLKQVKALLDDGIINEKDFEKMKQKIIDTMN